MLPPANVHISSSEPVRRQTTQVDILCIVEQPFVGLNSKDRNNAMHITVLVCTNCSKSLNWEIKNVNGNE
jgi:hypothetical protein